MEPTIAHGHPVTARDLEAITSTWYETRYVSLLNSLVLATLRSPAERMALNERINVKDCGVDAIIDVPSTGTSDPAGLVGAGRTVYQFKRRDSAAGDRGRIVAELKRTLAADAAKVASVPGHVDRFVAIVNVDVTRKHAVEIETAIRAGTCGSLAPVNSRRC